MISDSMALSQTPAKAVRPRTWGQCVTWYSFFASQLTLVQNYTVWRQSKRVWTTWLMDNVTLDSAVAGIEPAIHVQSSKHWATLWVLLVMLFTSTHLSNSWCTALLRKKTPRQSNSSEQVFWFWEQKAEIPTRLRLLSSSIINLRRFSFCRSSSSPPSKLSSSLSAPNSLNHTKHNTWGDNDMTLWRLQSPSCIEVCCSSITL